MTKDKTKKGDTMKNMVKALNVIIKTREAYFFQIQDMEVGEIGRAGASTENIKIAFSM